MEYGSNKIQTEQSLFEYLNKQLQIENGQSTKEISEYTICYLANLLTKYSHSSELLTQEQYKNSLPTLAFLYRDAREAVNENIRINLLRKLGDSALFMGAWFAKLYQKKGIGKDYFLGMGSAAYEYLADNAYHQREVFNELAQNMPPILHITSSALSREKAQRDKDLTEGQFIYNDGANSQCNSSLSIDNAPGGQGLSKQEIIELYQQYLEEKDALVEKQLIALGLLPSSLKPQQH